MRLILSLLLAVAWTRADNSPPISSIGKKRAEREMSQLETGLSTAQQNASISEKNVRTLEDEINELGVLEKEHAELKARYEDYLNRGSEELKRNDVAVFELATEEQKSASSPKGDAIKPKIEEAKMEIAERKRWKDEVQGKISRAKALLEELSRGLVSVEGKRVPLIKELNSWKERQREYERLARELADRKAKLQELLGRPD